MKKTNAIIIMDGFGLRAERSGNAIVPENIPNVGLLMKEYPFAPIGASGMDVGLPEGQMGNSEVGHTNIGAGRIVYQELTRITKEIKDGTFYQNPVLLGAVKYTKENGTKLHLIGLVSDGGVHSHIDHIEGLLELCRRNGLDNVFVHCLMDGRDTPPTSGKGYIEDLEARMEKIGVGRIATVSGRYWGMDRDNRWERVKRAYDAIADGKGLYAPSGPAAMQQSYERGENDEFVQPTVIEKNGKAVATVEDRDSIIFFNFRPDRAREITRAFIEPDFSMFPREGGYKPVHYVTMTQYDATFTNLEFAFAPQSLENVIGQVLGGRGFTQLRIAETEKYAHVTFFFNGGVEQPFPGEDRALIPSPKVATYDLKPEMSAYEVCDEAIRRVESHKYDVMVLNFANCDMVGHTGIFDAAWKAVHVVDECVGKVVAAVLATGGTAIVTADHGNAEMMVDPVTGEPFTAHTTNPVPFILVDEKLKGTKPLKLREGGRLSDIVPTLMDVMGMEKPKEMTGESLIKIQ
jgi:2,3-bisphosphoglycerate-independent phosphoglycerate mutase